MSSVYMSNKITVWTIKDLEELQDVTAEILKTPHAIRFGGKLFVDYYKFDHDVLIGVVLVPLFAPPDYEDYMSLSVFERVKVTFDYCSLVLREVYGRELISSQGKLILNRDNMSVLCATNDNDFDNFTYSDIRVLFESADIIAHEGK